MTCRAAVLSNAERVKGRLTPSVVAEQAAAADPLCGRLTRMALVRQPKLANDSR